MASAVVCTLAVPHGFYAVVYACVAMRFSLPVVLWAAMKRRCGFHPLDLVRWLWKPALCTALMAGLALLLQRHGGGALWSWGSIGLCVLCYGALLFLLARREVRQLLSWFGKRKDG